MNLSGGNKRRVCLLTSLIGESDVIVFDSPFFSLDNEFGREFVEILRREKKFVVIFTGDKRVFGL